MTVKESTIGKQVVDVTFYKAKPKCADNSTYDEATVKCLCDSGYVDDGNGGCKVEIIVPVGCQVTDSSGKCTTCEDGYALDANGSCVELPEGCTAIDPATGACISCDETRYSLQDGVCQLRAEQ